MSRLPLAALLLALPAAAALTTSRAGAQIVAVRGTPDSVAMDAALARARRQATDGDLAGARLVLDSLATVAEPGSMRLAEVLFWRATYARTAAGAERDYRRIVIEHPLSPRTEDALMRLAQLELARGDQQMAVRHLERLVLEHPESPNRARARYWTARAWMDAGESAKGCAALGEALVSSGGTDAELRNQVRYAGQRCPKGWDAAANASTAASNPATRPAVVDTMTVTDAEVARAMAAGVVEGRATAAAEAPRAEPPRQGMQTPPRESVTTLPPAPPVARTSTPAPMPPSLGSTTSSPAASSASLPAPAPAPSSRVDSAAGRGAPPNTNIAPPSRSAVTTSARPASTARPPVVVPPLATPPKGVGTSAVAGTVVGAPPSRPPSGSPSDSPSRPAPPSTTPTSVPAATQTSATTSATTSARSGAGAGAGARRTIYSVQLAAYDTRADAESLVRRLTGRGIDARVSGDVAPFRVRVGRWATRAEAARELSALKAKGHNGWVAEEAAASAGGGTR